MQVFREMVLKTSEIIIINDDLNCHKSKHNPELPYFTCTLNVKYMLLNCT